jgi:dihydroorotate dehydrogenase
MPDWSYQTVLKPLLFALPPRTARDLSLGLMGTLARLPLGSAVIDFMGHMRPPAGLRRRLLGLGFPSPVGLACGLDPEGRGTAALARFGVGFIEIGPITLRPRPPEGVVERHASRESIRVTDAVGLDATARRLARGPRAGVPIVVRLAVDAKAEPQALADECRQMFERLGPHAAAFSVTPAESCDWTDGAMPETLVAVVNAARAAGVRPPLLLCLPTDLASERAHELVDAAAAAGFDGFWVDGALRLESGREIGRPALEPALVATARLRQRIGAGAVIVGSGGVHEPEDALRMIEAGADLVAVDSGLVFSGPGLPKRIGEAVLFANPEPALPDGDALRATEQSWLWAFLMGLGMLFGSLLALGIAMTRVVLPYDEQFAGLTRAELHAVNHRLLPFLTHDRVSLAGTMVAIGVLYSGLAWFGMRQGLHWARGAVLSSAFAGSATFFLFLGFGYFDPFHAFVTAVLFQFLLLALHCRTPEPHGLSAPELRNDRPWRLGQWGQLGLILQGCAFVGAGLTISFIGITQVFVPEDLEFMGTTADHLRAASPHLVPLVAHDRASLGGMLLAAGIAFLLTALWGFRRGARWLWWTMLIAGLPGYGAAIAVHFAVGYRNPWHLTPAFAGLGLFALSMALAHPHLCRKDTALAEAWLRHRRV